MDTKSVRACFLSAAISAAVLTGCVGGAPSEDTAASALNEEPQIPDVDR